VSEAALYGALGASSLCVGAIIAIVLRPSNRVIGWVLAFGAGALISAVAYELVLDAIESEKTQALGVGIAIGALTFYLGDLWIDRRGGQERKGMDQQKGEGNALAIFLGTLLDGIPESFILGMTIQTQGEVGLAFLAAVFVSNLPEGMAASSGFRKAGWSTGKIIGVWLGVAAASAFSAAFGYALFGEMSSLEGIYVAGFAAGALLTMLSDTMLPEAYEQAGPSAGLWTTLGFSVAIAITTLE